MRILHDYECEQAETDICTCGADEARHYKTTIARLTAERDGARAEAAAAYERAAQVCARNEERAFKQGRGDFWAHRIDKDEIRALATEAGTTALAEIIKKAVDAETRACIAIVEAAPDDEVSIYGTTYIQDRLTARIDQRKEAV